MQGTDAAVLGVLLETHRTWWSVPDLARRVPGGRRAVRSALDRLVDRGDAATSPAPGQFFRAAPKPHPTEE